MKRLILCADDYGLAPGVSRAIRALAAAGRLNATSAMTPGADLLGEAQALAAARPAAFQVGLHVTLTGGLAPLSGLDGGRFPTLSTLMARAFLRLLDLSAVAREIEAQFDAFETAFGRKPDFIDGHQHVHLLPGVRSIVLGLATRRAPEAWLRQCAGPRGAGTGVKGRVIAALSGGLRREAAALGVPTNPAFSGAYDFDREPDFAALFPRFLEGLPDGGVVMVHPGHVDEALKAVDPVHGPREAEFAYLSGADFPRDLERAGFALT